MRDGVKGKISLIESQEQGTPVTHLHKQLGSTICLERPEIEMVRENTQFFVINK